MKRIAIVVLVAQFGVAGVFAAERSTNVRMKVSGDSLATTISLADNDTITDEETLAGDGTLGSFTFHALRTDGLAAVPPATCAPPLVFFPVVTGSGVFRFDDGSLLVVNITGGGGCIDFSTGVAQLIETYEVVRGTGRFAHASGTLTLTGALMPVVFNTSGNPQLLTITGKLDGRVSGLSQGDEQ